MPNHSLSVLDFINISDDAANIVSHAGIQSKAPIIHQLRVGNTSDVDLKNFDLRIGASPSFI